MKTFAFFTFIITNLFTFTKIEAGELCPICQRVETVIPIQEITSEMMVSFAQGEREDIRIQCPAQTTLPLKDLFIKGELLNLQLDKEIEVTFKKTFYLKCNGKEILFSLDCSEWKPLLEFITGEIHVSFPMEEGRVVAKIGAEVNSRS